MTDTATMGDRILDALPDPDNVGESAYRALHEDLADTIVSAGYDGTQSDREIKECVLGEIDNFIEWAQEARKKVAALDTMTVYVVSFCPAHEDRASVGGFEWGPTYDEVEKYYFRMYQESKDDGDTHIVRLLAVDVDKHLDRDEVTSDLDARLDELENTAKALRQYVPADSQYPPIGGTDQTDS